MVYTDELKERGRDPFDKRIEYESSLATFLKNFQTI